MMAYRVNYNTVNSAIESLSEHGFDGMAQAMTILMNEVMKMERSQHLQSSPYERTPDRQDYANGYKPKRVNTRIGRLDLEVPQVRQGDFYPSTLEKGMRSERALRLALAEMYVQGVSTRRVKQITQELCGLDVSSSQVSRCAQLLDEELQQWRDRRLGEVPYVFLDARYEKVRQGGCVIDSAVLVAYGIGLDGKRQILGTSVSLSESEVHWRAFLESLTKRGLHGVKLIISDAHAGLKAARMAVFPSIPWQRCQFHLQQNASSYVPKQAMKKEVATDIRAVFNAPNLTEAMRLLDLLSQKYAKTAPQLVEWMEQNLPEGLTVMQFPQDHRRRLRTSNIAERVNEEIRRRTRVAGLFPNVASCLRLVTAVLVEIDEDWNQGKSYLNMNA
jgi:putative transposase